MARLATVAAPHLCGRVRCCSAHHAYDTVLAEPFRFLPAQGAYTFCARSAKWWFALASRFSPARKPKGMDCQPSESVSIFAFRSLYVSSCGSDLSCFVPDVFGVCQISRQTVFCPGARHRSLAVFR